MDLWSTYTISSYLMEDSLTELRTVCKIVGKLGKLTLQPFILILFNWKQSRKVETALLKCGGHKRWKS